jgi:hypothetical protein
MTPRPRSSRRLSLAPRLALIATMTLGVQLAAPPAQAEVQLNWSGMIQTDIRFRVNDVSVGKWYNRQDAGPGISRNDNLFRLKLVADAGRFAGVAEIDFSYYGFSLGLEGFEDIYRQELVDAFRIEARAAYIQANDLLVEGLDLRIGQQVIAWGVGDQFNPTNVINAPDVEDPLLFGEQLANVMVKLDYSPKGNFVFSAVMVPVFRPALLPRTAPLGLSFSERLPFTNQALRFRVHTENWFVAQTQGYPTAVDGATLITPDFSLNNIQWAARMAGNVAGHDLALMFYYGRSPIPQSFISVAKLDNRARCNPIDPTDCINGTVATTTGLYFPRFWMLGFNATGELPNPLSLISKKIKGIGYRLEFGMFFPQAVSTAVIQQNLDFGGGLSLPSGEYAYPGGQRPTSVASTPFPKWVLGLDYTFTSDVYLNVQWVHGMVNEFGAGGLFSDGEVARAGGFVGDQLKVGTCAAKVVAASTGGGGDADFGECAYELTRPRIGDYLVAGLDVKFLDQKGFLRLFVVLDLVGITEDRPGKVAGTRERTHHGPFSEKGFSMVVFPELTYNFGKGFELSAGALLQFGKEWTVFGDPAAGGHQIWTRARFTY